MAQGLALSLIFLSFVIVTGMGGMVSLAQATFVDHGRASPPACSSTTTTCRFYAAALMP